MGPMLPKIKNKKKVKRVKDASPKPDWNGRFYVDSLGNFTNKHNHFKVGAFPILTLNIAIF